MPRIYTHEQKVALVTKVDQMLNAGLGKTAAAQAAGTNWSSYTNWVRGGIRPARRPSPVFRSDEEKARLVAAVQARMNEGITAQAACREVGIERERFFTWRKQIAPLGPMRPVEIVASDVTALVPLPSSALVPAAPATITESRVAALAPGREPAGLCLVAPGGYRIEGLDVETAAALLRALA